MITRIELIINILLHVFILFGILSLIFWLIICKLEKESINDELNNNINNYFNNLKSNLTPEQRSEASNFLNENNQFLITLNNIYSKPDQLNQNNNNWLKKSNFLYIFILLFVLISILLTIKYVCNINNFPILGIIKENIVLFIGIGIIEVFFFINIGSKYIPSKPSAIIKNTVTNFKKSLE
jgi:hypothetical protein